jgi:SAM-dependent methyltransferase
MRNTERWTPSKFCLRDGRLRASRDETHTAVGSRLIGDLVAACYEENLPVHVRGRLVDLGCGQVPLYGAYHALAAEVVTLDWSQSAHGDSHVDVYHDLNLPLPFEDGSFDTVILSDVLEHIARPEMLCAEIARILSGAGRLIGNVPFCYPIHEEPHDYYRYTAFGLRDLMDRAGLVPLVLDAVGGSIEVWADMLAKHLSIAGPAGRFAAARLQSLTYWFGRTRSGRRLMQESATRYPLGYFFVARRRV